VKAHPPFGRAGSVARHDQLVPAIVRLLTDLAEQRTLVLAMGGLDTIDALSMQLLWYLAHLALERRWVLLATCRDERLETDPELQRVIDASVRQGLCTHIRLPCLPRRESDQLVRAVLRDHPVDRALLDQMYSLTLGNAHFLVELARALGESGEVNNGPANSTLSHLSKHVPGSIQILVESNVANLEPNVRQVLRLLAAAQGDLTLAEYRAAAKALRPSVTAAAFLDALDRALAMQLVQEVEGQYSFRHPLVGATLYAGLTTHRRLQYEAALRPARRVDGEIAKLTAVTPRVASSGSVAGRAEVTQ
jgi:predicted ATPase